MAEKGCESLKGRQKIHKNQQGLLKEWGSYPSISQIFFKKVEKKLPRCPLVGSKDTRATNSFGLYQTNKFR